MDPQACDPRRIVSPPARVPVWCVRVPGWSRHLVLRNTSLCPGCARRGPLGRRGAGGCHQHWGGRRPLTAFCCVFPPLCEAVTDEGLGARGGSCAGQGGVHSGGWVLAPPFPEWVRHVRSHRSPRFSLCRSPGPREGESGRQARASGVPAAEGDAGPSVPCARGLRCVALQWQC